jgi:hypothetical protein
LKKAVAIMTPAEKQNADSLTDEQTQKIAEDARIDPANFAIFINGYALCCKRVPPSEISNELRKSTKNETN